MRLLNRLAGIETEYVARFAPDADADPSDRPLTFELLHQLVRELRRRLPVVDADYPKKGFFLATGGAVWHERPGEGVDYPLIEGSTPECRGPRQLLAYSRGQDTLLSAAARDVSGAGGEFTLCKSDSDAKGNVYGSQENYEVVVASGWRLLAWRVGVVLLLPLVAFAWAAMMVIVAPLMAYLIIAWVTYGAYAIFAEVFRRYVWLPKNRTVRNILVGPPGGGEPLRFMPAWLAWPVTFFEHVAFTPLALGLAVLAQFTAFAEQRRALLPLLATRAVFAGSGRLDRRGRFHVASKAHGMRLANGVGIFRVRSIFSLGPQAKSLQFFGFSPHHPSLLRRRQRLQISLGDGNLCDEAEYLRVGTTMLVLDAVEAGYPIPVPRLRRPMRVLHAIASDPTLTTRVAVADGRELGAIEVQRIYLEACERFVESQGDPPAEALELLRRWRVVLDDLDADPRRLIGRVDWVTKRWLLETCTDEAETTPASRQKIALRYHELSPDGYFERLRSAGVIASVLTREEVEAAMSIPPANTPAATRGRLIRESKSSGETVKANWQSVLIGTPPAGKRIPCGDP